MTKQQAIEAMEMGFEIEAGTGEDHDTGQVLAILDDERAEIAWRSGVRTPCHFVDMIAA